jgi:hypothetical protein
VLHSTQPRARLARDQILRYQHGQRGQQHGQQHGQQQGTGTGESLDAPDDDDGMRSRSRYRY